ncbi:MAG TPA: hypothetical protein VFX76_16025 [Roseiflexaceae bacterium]|nr:hypothetical protein [Roseiflexaceae bacterium]
MRYRLATEEIEPEHWLAWALDLPGCFSAAPTQAEATKRAPDAIARYYTWLAENDASLVAPEGAIKTGVVETFAAFPSANDPKYRVNAFFDDDRRPLSYWDTIVALRLLVFSRAAFLQALGRLGDWQTEASGSIVEIVRHVAGAENWYLWRLGLGVPREHLPTQPLDRLEAVRGNAQRQLWTLIGDTRIVEYSGERWSARKLVRRMLWHERDHCRQLEAMQR